MEDIKQIISRNFSKAAPQYEQEAILQKMCAERLAQIIKNYQTMIKPGIGAEIGCGTGFLTKELLTLFPTALLDITDLSSQMVEFCKSKYACSTLNFSTQDGENFPRKGYAFIASSLVFQWFRTFSKSLSQLRDSLHPKGLLFYSTLIEGSFREWKAICESHHLPFTANPLPKVEDLQGLLEIQTYSLAYSSALHFFRHLKAIGASTSLQNPLNPVIFKQLINAWNSLNPSEISITYRVAYGMIQNNRSEKSTYRDDVSN